MPRILDFLNPPLGQSPSSTPTAAFLLASPDHARLPQCVARGRDPNGPEGRDQHRPPGLALGDLSSRRAGVGADFHPCVGTAGIFSPLMRSPEG
jgi:hypothetical protein